MSTVGNEVALNYIHMGCLWSVSSRASCRVRLAGARYTMHPLMEVLRERGPGRSLVLFLGLWCSLRKGPAGCGRLPLGGERAPDVPTSLPWGGPANLMANPGQPLPSLSPVL